jgi:hypothetical protein
LSGFPFSLERATSHGGKALIEILCNTLTVAGIGHSKKKKKKVVKIRGMFNLQLSNG